MKDKFWRWLAIALVAVNAIYWLIMPVWNWKAVAEQHHLSHDGRLTALEQAVVNKHPEFGQPQQPPPPEEEIQ